MITVTIKAQYLDNFIDTFITTKRSLYAGDFEKYLEHLNNCHYFPQDEASKFFKMYTSYHSLHNEIITEDFTLPLDVYYYMINTSTI